MQGLHARGLARSERRLMLALAASALLHALMLAAGVREPAHRPAALPLRVELRALPEPEAAAPRAQPQARLVADAPPAPKPVTVTKSPDPPPVLRPAEPMAPVLSAASPGPEAVPVPTPAPAGMPASLRSPAAPREGVAAPAREEEPEGLDPDALREYRFALARAVTRHYPPLARRQGLSGTAEVRLTVAAGGAQRAVALKRSSGHGVLDAEAQAMISGAAERAPIPERLRGREFAVDLPVRFELHEAGD